MVLPVFSHAGNFDFQVLSYSRNMPGLPELRNSKRKVKGLERWKNQAIRLKVKTYAIYLAYKDPRVPWHARLMAACVVAYFFSPIDLIPDFIPILGYVDDLVLIPLGVTLVLKMIPAKVMDECREKAKEAFCEDKPKIWAGAGLIVFIWLSLISAILLIGAKVFFKSGG